eukprot:NODE_38_length_30618_cov_0.377142.p17 type:complete len:162 gc:universal NODE_38_length_30618_cov_0.377142:20173-19688(-)
MTELLSPFSQSNEGVLSYALNPNIENTVKFTIVSGLYGLGLGLFKQLNNPFLTSNQLAMYSRYTLKYGGLGLVFMSTQMFVKQFATSEKVPFATALLASGIYLGVRKGQLGRGVMFGTAMGLSGLIASVFMTKKWTDGTLEKPLMLNYLKETKQVRDKYYQ